MELLSTNIDRGCYLTLSLSGCSLNHQNEPRSPLSSTSSLKHSEEIGGERFDWGRKMLASGSPYAAARIQRADHMECAARSAAVHKMGYENLNNPDSGSYTYPLGSNLDM